MAAICKHEQGDATTTDDSEKEGSEHNLVRAIQAAQQARGGTVIPTGAGGAGAGGAGAVALASPGPSGQFGGDGGGGGFGGGEGVGPRAWRVGGGSTVVVSDEISGRGGGGGGGESAAAAAVILALHMAWAALEAALEALLPLWMLSPGKNQTNKQTNEKQKRACYSCFYLGGGRGGAGVCCVLFFLAHLFGLFLFVCSFFCFVLLMLLF